MRYFDETDEACYVALVTLKINALVDVLNVCAVIFLALADQYEDVRQRTMMPRGINEFFIVKWKSW